MVIDITPAPILSKGWGTPTNAALETLAAQAQTADEVASIASSVAEAKFAEVSVDLVDATMTATADTPSSDFAQHLNGTIGALSPADAQLTRWKQLPASEKVYIGLGDSTRDAAGPSPYYYDELEAQTASDGLLAGMSTGNIISQGRNGASLASMLADPTWVSGMTTALAGRPGMLDLSALTNDVRSGGLGTTVDAIATAGAALLLDAIGQLRTVTPTPIIKVTVPAPYLATGGYVTVVTPAIATEGVRAAFYRAAAAHPDVILQDPQAEIYGFTTTRPFDGDQLHPGITSQGILARSVAAFIGGRPPLDRGRVTAAYVTAPATPWTAYPRVVEDSTKFALVAYGDLPALGATGSEFFRILWPYLRRNTFGQAGDVVSFSDGNVFAPTSWNGKTQNGNYTDVQVSGIPDTAVAGGTVRIYRPLVTGDAAIDAILPDTSRPRIGTTSQRRLFGIVHTAGTSFIRVQELTAGADAAGDTVSASVWNTLVASGWKAYFEGDVTVRTLSSAGSSNQGWEASSAFSNAPASFSAYVGKRVVLVPAT